MSAVVEDAASTPPPPPAKLDFRPGGAVDKTFAATVLQLQDSDETSWDTKLSTEATSLGLYVHPPPRPNVAPPPVVRPVLLESGRSISIDSFISRTSTPTVDSLKSWDRSSTNVTSAASVDRRNSQTSSHDSVLSQPLQSVKSHTSSPPSTSPRPGAQSPDISSARSSPHKNLTRGFNRFRLRRQGSERSSKLCHHCARIGIVDNETVYPLPCGHAYCMWALNNLVQSTYAENPSARPACCDQALSQNLINLVKIGQTARSSSAWSVEDSEQENGGAPWPSPLGQPDDPDAVARHNLRKAIELDEYRRMRTSHVQQRNRLLRWDAKQKAELIASTTRKKKQAAQEVAQRKQEEETKHSEMLIEVEDKHISAEANLRAVQENERKNNLTALRHMEAFCQGRSTTGDDHNRVVTDQDRRELERARRLRDTMDARHESAINVLRGEQTQRMRARQKRHEQQLSQHQERHDKELDGLQQELDAELAAWNQMIGHKKLLLERWWIIETRIFLKQCGRDIGLRPDDPILGLQWRRGQNLEDVEEPVQDDTVPSSIALLVATTSTTPQ